MSNLDYMDKLLDGVEVEWKTLADITLPTSNIKWRDVEHTHLYIDLSSVSIETKKIIETSEVDATNAPSRAQKIIQEGDVIFATTRPTQMRYCLIDDIYSGQIASTGYCVLRPQISKVLPKWILYCIASKRFKSHVENNESGAAYPAISDTKIKAFEIPVLPLNIQAEIIQILDTFTELTAELTTELVARKQQYAYYRDQLLTFEEGEVDWKALGSLAENLDSKRKPITSGLRESGSIPYYGASGIVDYVKDYIFDGDYLLISEDGANLTARNTPIAFSISGKNWVNNHAHVLKFETYAERRYVEYYLNSIELTPYISGAAQPKLNQKNLNSIKIPSPSLKEQERIVAILDKFDTLTTSLTEGLPREIELRQQQYEYYRELLLSFPKAEVADHD